MLPSEGEYKHLYHDLRGGICSEVHTESRIAEESHFHPGLEDVENPSWQVGVTPKRGDK